MTWAQRYKIRKAVKQYSENTTADYGSWGQYVDKMNSNNKLPLWARLLRWFGWNVEQDYHVMMYDHQGAVVPSDTGLVAREIAENRCARYNDGRWVRRVITVWHD